MKKAVIAIIIAVVVVAGGSYMYINSKKQEKPKVTAQASDKVADGSHIQKEQVDNKKIENKDEENYSDTTYKKVNVEGISIEIPTFLNKGKNNSFASKNEQVQLVVNTINNMSLKNYYNNRLEKINKVSYKYLGEKTYSLSWETNNIEFYQSGIAHGDNVITFTMSYPKKDGKAFNSIVTKVYNSFIKNQSANVNSENIETFTSENAEKLLKTYLLDIGYTFKKETTDHGSYSYGLETFLNNKNITADTVDKNNSDTMKNLNAINSEKYKYGISYMNYVNQEQTSHASRIGTFYVTPNGIYLLGVVNLNLTKIANIDNGKVQVIKGREIISNN